MQTRELTGLRLADEIGPDRLSTSVVARTVGLSQPAIFRHFPTKGALWLAVAEDIAVRLRNDRASADAQVAAPYARRGFSRIEEGLRLFDVRMALLRPDAGCSNAWCG